VLVVSSSSEALAAGNVLAGTVAERMAGGVRTLAFVPNDRRLGLRLGLPRLSLDEAKAKYDVDSLIPMVVTGLHDNGGSAWLESVDGTEGRVVRADVGAAGVPNVKGVLTIGQEVEAIVREVKEHNGKVQIQVALPTLSAPTMDDIEKRYPTGTVATMRVTGISPDGGRAWLQTIDGIGAMALRKDAGEGGVSDLNAVLVLQADVEARVLAVGEHNGSVQLKVALPSVSSLGDARPTAATASDVLDQYPIGSSADFTVTGMLPDGRRAFLKTTGGVEATITADKIGSRGVLAVSAVLSVGDEIQATVTQVGEHKGQPQLQLEMRDLEVPDIQTQLAELRIVPDEIHDGTIQNVTDFGVFVTIAGVSGLVHKSKLPGSSTTGYSRGDPLRVRVDAAGEDPRKPGSLKIDLTPV
jgi:predicted RNA-binding protein with RPS1 domain